MNLKTCARKVPSIRVTFLAHNQAPFGPGPWIPGGTNGIQWIPRFPGVKNGVLVEFLVDFTTFILVEYNLYIYANISVWNSAGKNKIVGREFV